MTKSGIGTEGMVNPSTQQSNHHHHHHQQQQPNASTSSIVISKTEIPIWVSDRKKWVTGINKRTTVNDLIFAVLKQCQVISGGQLVGNYSNAKQLSQSKTSLNENVINQASLMDQIGSLFVLVEYYFELDSTIDTTSLGNNHHGQCSSQRLLDNDSKVYKYFNKWLQSPNSYMLKILQRQMALNEPTQPSNIETTEHQQVNGGSGHSSLATKLLRKFGVSSTSGSTGQSGANSSINTAPLTHNSSSITSQIPPPHLTTGRSSSSYRFVDVKLPVAQPQSRSKSIPNQQQQPMCPPHQNHSPTASNSTTSSNNTASSNNTSSSDKQRNGQSSFDPAAQKVFLYNSIVDKENKLRQQRERFKLIDELLKETEKKSSKYMSNNTSDAMLYDSSVKPLNLLAQLKHAHIDLTDVYSNFPEMRTNNLEDVEEFSQVCNRLFQLDEDIKEQKDMLNKLESELQRELNSSHLPNNNNNNFSNGLGLVNGTATNGGDSIETMQLRKEVSLSREQTRIQCKQLHDLDAKMRLNEQSLALKEQQLQKLLEELYIEEMYADSALENEIHNESSASFGQNGRSRSRQQVDNEPPNNMDYYYEQDASHNNQSDDHLIINDELLLNSDRVEHPTTTNRIEFNDDTLPIHHHNIDYIDHHLNQMLLNAANAKVELKINNESVKYNGQQQPQSSSNTGGSGGSIRISGSNSHQFLNGLTPSQKSLSYGNLLHGNEPNSIKINNLVSPTSGQVINQPLTGQKQNTFKSNMAMNMNGSVKPNTMKTSPSLDLNKAQQQYTNGKVINNGKVDQSGNGDNDSGISSVSSEATTTITTNHHTTMLTTTSSSNSCQNITNIPINMMNQYQRQQYFQQHQQQQIQRQYQAAKLHQQQQQSVQQTSTKPVLETLV